MKEESTVILFSLFVTVMLGCGHPLGNPDEAAALAVIQKLGGKVEFDSQGADRRILKVYLHATKVQDADLAVLEKLPKLRNLFLGKTSIGDAGIEHLQKVAELQTLSLNSSHVTDVGLKSLAELKNLKTINLQETKVTAEGVSRLQKALPAVMIAR